MSQQSEQPYAGRAAAESKAVQEGRRYRPALVLALASVLWVARVAAAPLAYVSNPDFGSILVIDSATDTVVTTINTGGAPQLLATSPSGEYLYAVSNGNVTIVDTATNASVGSIPVPGVADVAVHPTGDRLYLSNGSANGVSVASTATQTIIDAVSTSSTASFLVAHPAGAKVYIVRPDRIDIAGTATNTLIGFINIAAPVGIALNPAGTRAYVTSSFYGTLSVVDTASDAVINTIPVGSGAYTVAVHPDGSRIYVVRYLSSVLSVVDAASETVVATTGLRSEAFGVAVHPDGTRLYVVNSGTTENTVSVLHTDTLQELALIPAGYRPLDIAFAAEQPTTAVTTTIATGYFHYSPGTLIDGELVFDDVVRSVFGRPYNLYSALGGAPVDLSATVTGYNGTVLSFSCEAIERAVPPQLRIAGPAYLGPSPTALTWPIASVIGDVLQSGPFYTLTMVPDSSSSLSGPFTITAALAANTPAAANVTVPATTSIRQCPGQSLLPELPVSVTFANVTAAGETYVTGTCRTPGTFPGTIALDLTFTLYFDVVTTAAYEAPITICIGYPDATNDGIVDFTSVSELQLRILHNADGSAFEPPVNQHVDAVNNRVCAEVSSLSPFALGVEGAPRGFVPTGDDSATCAAKVLKLLAKHTKVMIKCDRKAAEAAATAKAFDVVACKSAARTKYDEAIAALSACPACLTADAASLADRTAGLTALLNGAWYCDGGDPLPHGVVGFTPIDVTRVACGKKMGSQAAKLIKKLTTCYRKSAAAAMDGALSKLDACTAAAASSSAVAVGQLGFCPSCALDNAPAVRAEAERFTAGIQEHVYCDGSTPLP